MRINGREAVVDFDAAKAQELMDEFAEMVAGRPAGTWAPWVIYFLECLDARLPADDMDALLLELERAIVVRRNEGIW